MKRSSKILAVLLTALLIMGVFATAIFASDLKTMSTNTPKLTFSNVDGIRNCRNENFTGKQYYLNVNGAGTGSAPSFSLIMGNFKRSSANFTTVQVGADGKLNPRCANTDVLNSDNDVLNGSLDNVINTYGRVWNTAATTTTGSGSYLSFGGSKVSDDTITDNSYLSNDFLVTELDFAADQYVYTVGDVKYLTDDITTIPEGTAYDISYDSGLNFAVHNGCSGYSRSTLNKLVLVSENNQWYIKNNSTKTQLPLNREVGNWNHITFIYEIDNRVDYTETEGGETKTAKYEVYAALTSTTKALVKNYLSNSKLHIYVNGVKLSSCNLLDTDPSQIHTVGPTEIRINHSKGTFSYAVDNVTMNYYKGGYDGELAKAFAGDNVPETLGEYDDIVYNYRYTMSAPNTTYAASVTSRGDNGKYTTAYYYTVVEALSKLKKDDILSLTDGVAININPTAPFYMVRNVDKTNVTYGNGYSESAVNGGYYVATASQRDQLIPNGAERVEVPGFTKYDIWTTTSSTASPSKTAIEGPTNFATGCYTNKYETVNGNTYVLRRYAQTETHQNTIAGTPYDGIKMGNGTVAYGTGSDKTDTDGTDADFSLMHFDYVTVDFDIASDMYLDSDGKLTEENTGKLAYLNGVNFALMVRIKNDNVAKGWQSMKIANVDGAWYLQRGDTSERIPLSANVGEWNHITYVFKINTVKGGTVEAPTYAFGTSKCYVYVNGNYFFDTNWSPETDMDEASAETYGFDSIRINYLHSAKDTGKKNDAGKTIYDISHATQFSMLLDNPAVNYYTQGYEGDLATFMTSNPKNNITSCDDVVFDGEYKFESPNISEANVTIKNEILNIEKEYTFVENAAAELKENDTLVLNGGATLLDYVPSFVFDVICDEGGFTLADTVTDYVAVRTADGYIVRLTSDYTNDVLINWYGWDGTLLYTTNSNPGAKPSNIPNVSFYREDGNKFYYLEESDEWLLGSLEGKAVDPAELAAGTHNLYANMIVPVLDIEDSLILFNLTVANRFEMMLYVPYMSEDGEFLYNSASYLIGGEEASGIEYNGVKYATTIVNYPSAVSGVDTTDITITATIGEYESTQTVELPSVPTYIEKVLAGNFDYYTKKLCVNMARYCDEIYNYTREYREANNITDDKLDEVSPYNEYCTGDYADYLIKTTTPAFNTQIAQDARSENLNRIIDYFDGATFYLANTGIPRLAFVPKTLAEGATLPKEIIGVYYTYNAFKGEDPYTVALPMDVTGNQNNSANTGIYMNVNRNERIYFYANDLKITVYFKDGSSETGTYNLASYIKGIEESGVSTTGTSVDVAKAMYAYSMAAIEYLTTPEGTAAPAAN